MKLNLKRIAFALSFSIVSSLAIGQVENVTGKAVHESLTELTKHKTDKTIPVLTFQKPDLALLLAEDLANDDNGTRYRFGISMDVDITTENSGEWTTNDKGDRVWKLKIHQPDARALSFIFSTFDLKGDSYINVYDESGRKVHTTYTKKDVLESKVQNLSLCEGDLLTIVLVEPMGSPASVLEMEKLFYAYRSYGTMGYVEKINESESCQVNVNCSEGANWKDEKKGVAKIVMVVGNYQYLCTGSLVNNTNQDCKPYFLTAMHCVGSASPSDLNNWRFYFNYEASGCQNPNYDSEVPNQYVTGAQKLAGSDDVNGNTISKSDFFLLRIGTPGNEASIINQLKGFNAYWNGWDANNTASAKGVGIHHPAGDIKKISTYTQALESSSYSGVNQNTHWRVYWTSTASGHGVTEGGSSGSPLFNYNGGNSRIVGTLSGGSSYCSALTSPDSYGKMSYHWVSAGSGTNKQLKPWLDPGSTGVKVLDGSSDPCGSGGGGNPDPGNGACVPNPGACDEYIANVTLNTINNSTGCDGYTDYSSTSTTLVPGNSYQVGVMPGIIGTGVGNYYAGDVIGVWIDWNGDGVFSGGNETIVIEALSQSSPATHSFTVPSGVTPGTYVMRVRIDFDYAGAGNISPCGDSDYGEVEDYRVVIGSGSGGNPIPSQEPYDLEVVLSSPASGSSVAPSASQAISFKVKNNGAGTVPAGDTLWFAYVHRNYITQQETIHSISTGAVNSANGLVINSSLAPGQSINMAQMSGAIGTSPTINTSLFGNGDQVGIWCLGSGNSPNGLTSGDPDDTNNSNNKDYFSINVQGGGTSGLEEVTMGAIGLYPNPATDQVVLDLNSNFKSVEVVVYDLTGKVVAQVTESNVETIALDFSRLATGVYQVAIKTELGKTVKKVIKK